MCHKQVFIPFCKLVLHFLVMVVKLNSIAKTKYSEKRTFPWEPELYNF